MLKNCGFINPESIEEYIAAGGYEAASKALTSMTPEEVINEVKSVGTCGQGRSGLPHGRQMGVCAKSAG